MGHQSGAKSTMTSEQNNFKMRGALEGHCGWVTSIATTNENPEMILSASRDKTVMVWQLTREGGNYGYPKTALRGHGHFVEEAVLLTGDASVGVRPGLLIVGKAAIVRTMIEEIIPRMRHFTECKTT